jgi:hypothetical protein
VEQLPAASMRAASRGAFYNSIPGQESATAEQSTAASRRRSSCSGSWARSAALLSACEPRRGQGREGIERLLCRPPPRPRGAASTAGPEEAPSSGKQHLPLQERDHRVDTLSGAAVGQHYGSAPPQVLRIADQALEIDADMGAISTSSSAG